MAVFKLLKNLTFKNYIYATLVKQTMEIKPISVPTSLTWSRQKKLQPIYQ